MNEMSNSLDGQIFDNDTMFPSMALVVYDARGGDMNSQRYVEVAKFERTKVGYSLMPGRPLRKKDAREIAEKLSRGSQEFLKPALGTLIPVNIVSYGGTELEPSAVWFVKAHTRRAWFDKSTGIKGKSIPYPNIIFRVHDNKLFVYAYLEDVITPETTLYPLPLPNIYDTNAVCLGTGEVKQTQYLQELVNSYERAFFDTEYNIYHGIEDQFKGVNLVSYWNKCISTGIFDKSIYKGIHKKYIKLLKEILK